VAASTLTRHSSATDAELYCILNNVEFVSLAADVETLTKASRSSTVELIFTLYPENTNIIKHCKKYKLNL